MFDVWEVSKLKVRVFCDIPLNSLNFKVPFQVLLLTDSAHLMAEFDEPLTPTSPNIIHYVARLPSDDVTTHSTHLHENGSDAVTLQGGDFAVKSRVLADLAHEPLQHPHSFGLVLVMSALFLLFILLATASLLVFCRKKNTVFAATHAPLCKANHFSRYRYASADDASMREAYELESCSNVFSDDDYSTCTADDTRTDAGTCRPHLPSDAPSESASLLPNTPAHSEHRLSLPVVTNFIDLLAYADDSDSDVGSPDSAYCTQNCLDSHSNSVPPNLTELFQARPHPAQNSATSPSVAVALPEVGVINDTFDSVSTHSDVMSMTSSPQRQTTPEV